MRLSEIKGERSLDVIAELVGPIANIASDGEVTAMFKAVPPEKGQTAQQAFAKRMGEAIPILLKAHREDIIAILATLEGVSQEEYRKEMTLASVTGSLYELMTDEEFLSFLSSNSEKKAGK